MAVISKHCKWFFLHHDMNAFTVSYLYNDSIDIYIYIFHLVPT